MAESVPSVFNLTANTAHTSFGGAFSNATAFDAFRAASVSFRIESPIDPASIPLVVELVSSDSSRYCNEMNECLTKGRCKIFAGRRIVLRSSSKRCIGRELRVGLHTGCRLRSEKERPVFSRNVVESFSSNCDG